jgi:hypothetical protein
MPTNDTLVRVIAWNLKHQRSRTNWKAVGPQGNYRCDIALLNEARRPPDGLGLNIVTRGRTVGRDDQTYGGKKPGRPWATAIASPHPLQRPKDVWTERPSRTRSDKDRRSKLMESRRGAWTAAVVSFPNGEQVTAISLYGLLDERSDASVHRSLSDLTPLLEDPRYNELLLLGGDLNPLWSAEIGTATLARVQSVFDRITTGFGLKDLLQSPRNERRPRERLQNCTCSQGGDCRHVWTYRKHRGSSHACQDDYLFSSPALEERLDECYVPDFTDDSPSDHVPVVATFAGF